MRKKTHIYLFVILFCVFGKFDLKAQKGGGHNLYIEAAGSSLIYSLNYEYAIKVDAKSFFAPKFGLGHIPKLDNNLFFSNWTVLTPGLNYFIGGKRLKMELGGFATFLTRAKQTETYPGFLIGIRDVSVNGNIIRANFTPFFFDGKMQSFFGVSLGKNL